MRKSPKEHISEAEWEVMRVVWANQPVDSKTIITILDEKLTWKPSTVKTLLKRLVDKQFLMTEKNGRGYLYHANYLEKNIIDDNIEELLSRVCDKDEAYLVQSMIKHAKLSKLDLRFLIDQLKKDIDEAPEEITCQCLPGQCTCRHHQKGDVK